jgi:hypothetical protein
MHDRGHTAVAVGLMLHLTSDTQIYCDHYRDQPPVLVLGAEPADCVISTAAIDTEPADLVAADRLLLATIEYRNAIAAKIGSPDRLAASRLETDQASVSLRRSQPTRTEL